MTVVPATWEMEVGGLWSKVDLGKAQEPIQKKPKNKRPGGATQGVECLPSKQDALISVPSNVYI
jgi:hypothetical protein